MDDARCVWRRLSGWRGRRAGSQGLVLPLSGASGSIPPPHSYFRFHFLLALREGGVAGVVGLADLDGHRDKSEARNRNFLTSLTIHFLYR